HATQCCYARLEFIIGFGNLDKTIVIRSRILCMYRNQHFRGSVFIEAASDEKGWSIEQGNLQQPRQLCIMLFVFSVTEDSGAAVTVIAMNLPEYFTVLLNGRD